MTSVLLFGDYRHTLTVARSLHRAGHRVVAASPGPRLICSYSRHVDDCWLHSDPAANREQFAAELHDYLRDHPEVTAILPIGDDDIRLFLDCQNRIPGGVRVLMCDTASLDVFLDKAATARLVETLGIPLPATFTAGDRDSLITAVRTAGFPCVVKPLDSSFKIEGRKAVILADEAGLSALAEAWRDDDGDLVVQPYVSGPRFNLYFYAFQGHIVELGQTKALATDRPDGTGTTVNGITVEPSENLVAHCRRIVERLGYSGPGCMQFLVDGDGKAWFLEHNARLGASLEGVYRAGLDLPALMVDFPSSGQPPPDDAGFPCEVGVEFAWSTGDLFGAVKAYRDGDLSFADLMRRLGRMVRTGLTAPVHLTWDWRDPLPALARLSRTMVSNLPSK